MAHPVVPLTNESLIIRIGRDADPVSWEEFFALYEPFVHHIVRQCGVAAEDADDVVQEVFVSLIRALPRFEYSARRGRFRCWLQAIIRHRVVNWFRRRGSRHEVPLDEQGAWIVAEERSSDWEQAHRLHVVEFALQEVMGTSRDQTLRCFEEHFLNRRPAAEVAGELGMTAHAVYANTRRTLHRIRNKCLALDEELLDDYKATNAGGLASENDASAFSAVD